MEAVEDCNWVDIIMDEIGFALTKADETILKSIELWTELTKDMFDKQPTQELTGQPNNGISGEEHCSEDKSVTEVKERPIQHWALRFADVNEEPIQHWALYASKVQEQGNDHYDDHDGDGDGDDYDYEEEDETTVSESSENMWELNLGASATTSIPSWNHHQSEEDSGSSLRWKGGYELIKDVETSSKEDDESWHNDEEEEDETTVSEHCENMWELNLKTSAKTNIPSWHRYHNEEDSGSRLRWKGGYKLLKNVEKSSEEDDEVEECYSESLEEAMEMLWTDSMWDEFTEPLVGHDGEGDVSGKLQGFVDVRQEEIANDSEVETLLPECDWVYVTRD